MVGILPRFCLKCGSYNGTCYNCLKRIYKSSEDQRIRAERRKEIKAIRKFPDNRYCCRFCYFVIDEDVNFTVKKLLLTDKPDDIFQDALSPNKEYYIICDICHNKRFNYSVSYSDKWVNIN